MRSRQIAQSLFLAAGIAILILLIVPAVHTPFVVVHGPLTALRAQRSAWLVSFLLRAAAFLSLGLVFSIFSLREIAGLRLAGAGAVDRIGLKPPLRC